MMTQYCPNPFFKQVHRRVILTDLRHHTTVHAIELELEQAPVHRWVDAAARKLNIPKGLYSWTAYGVVNGKQVSSLRLVPFMKRVARERHPVLVPEDI